MSTAPLELRLLPIEQLVPAPYNPRRPVRPNDQVWNKLRRSIVEFGLVEPLVWNELTGHLVGGHLRWQILKELGVAEVPVSVVRLPPAREKALNVILNNREAQGRFDPERLAELLTELQDLPELELTGFDAADLRDLRLEPLEAGPMEAPGSPHVEVTLLVPRHRYDDAAAQIEELVRRLGVECHVHGL